MVSLPITPCRSCLAANNLIAKVALSSDDPWRGVEMTVEIWKMLELSLLALRVALLLAGAVS